MARFLTVLFFGGFFELIAQPPVAVTDTFVVVRNSNNVFAVTQNDTNFAGGPLRLNIVETPTNGQAYIFNSNQVNYIPSLNFLNWDSFTYSICDTLNLCDTGKVYVFVAGSNSTPVALSDKFFIEHGEDTVLLHVTGNDLDEEGDSLHVRLVVGDSSAIGRLYVRDGLVFFVRTPLSCGNMRFRYLVCDSFSCDTGQASVYVLCSGDITAPEGFSPNGDGKNDLLVFTGVEYFSPARLYVFNRYGSTVYESQDYRNDWNGTISNGLPVPDGTYYYVLELIDRRRYNSYLVITR